MKKPSVTFVLWLLLNLSSWGQESPFLSTASPKLREFLNDNRGTLQVFTNALAEAFTNRTVQLYYFYSDDPEQPRASHYYPSEAVVGILIRENQQPCDEFISLLFEVLNSEGEASFRELVQKAQSGSISRTNFAQEILRVEFKTAKKMRDLVGRLNIGKTEISKSYYYKRLIECPNKFEDFLDYTVRVSSPHRNPIKEYELQYDSIQGRKNEVELNSTRRP